MLVNRTDPKELYNYLSYPYAVKPTNWQQTAAKVTMIVVHILLSIISLGYIAIKTYGDYLTEKRKNEFYVSDANDMKRLLSAIRNNNIMHFQYDEGRFSGVSKEQFDRLNENEKQSFVDGLEIVIAQEDLKEKYSKEVNVLRTLRNEIFLSLNVSVNGFSNLPKDVLEQLILSRTSPNQIEIAKLVNKQFNNAATHRAKINSINNGQLCIPVALRNIRKTDEVIEWLEQDEACQSLRYADFRGFYDFNEGHLKKITQICPNLRNLYIQNANIKKLEKLPASLEVLFCSGCPYLTELHELPSSLSQLSLFDCTALEELPDLPNSLISLFCCNLTALTQLPKLPPSLKKLGCSGCDSLRTLPELPYSLTTLQSRSCDSLRELPELPAWLSNFDCSGCRRLKELPELPGSLIELDCSNCCRLQELPALPASLTKLNCSRCDKLTVLPKLPDSLTELKCSLNYALTDLPVLPASLKILYCDGCIALRKPPKSNPSLKVYK